MNKLSAGEQIKKERESRGLSLEYVAKASIMTIKRLEDYESGRVRPSTKSFNSIMDVFEKYDKALEDSKSEEQNDNSFNDMSYLGCCKELVKTSEILKRDFLECSFDSLPSVCSKLKDNSNSLKFLFHRSILIIGGFDKYLVDYTINTTMEYLMKGYKCILSSYRYFIENPENRCFNGCNSGLIISYLKDSLHSINYIFDYLNDYFRLEYGVILVEKNDKGIPTLSLSPSEVKKLLSCEINKVS